MAIAGGLVSLGIFICLWGILSLGLNIKFGYNGLLDIGHVAFYLVGAYTAALLVLPPDTVPQQAYATYILGMQWSWPPAILVGILAAGLFGMLVALPAIRLREDYLAIAVLGISVIAKRTIQTESWLANGPTSLKGWNSPMEGLFPMPGSGGSFDLVLFGVGVVDFTLVSISAKIIYGLIVFGGWTILTFGIARIHEGLDDEGMDLLEWTLAATTFGVGYLAARRARSGDGDVDLRLAAGGGAVYAIVATALAVVGGALAVVLPGVILGTTGTVTLGMFALSVYLVMGLASLSSWVLGGALLYNHYDELPRNDAVKGVVLGVVFALVFFPLILLGGGPGDILPAIGLIVVLGLGLVATTYRFTSVSDAGLGPGVAGGIAAGIAAAPIFVVGGTIGWAAGFVLLAGLTAGLKYLGDNWDEYGPDVPFGSLMGVVIGVGIVAVFVPAILLGGGADYLASLGVGVTVVLAATLVTGLYFVGDNWDEFGSDGAFVSVIGVAAVTLFALRYFLFSAVQPFKNEGVAGLVSTVVQNLLWLVKFTDGMPAFNYQRFFFLLMVFLLALVYLLAERTVKSPFGRVLKSIREDEDVATALGKNVFRYKVQSMILGSAIAGLAGALAAIYLGALVHTMFAPRVTFIALLMVVIGGTANNRGAILGAVIFWGFQQATVDLRGFFPSEMSSRIAALRLAFIGALFMVILYYRPQGIWGEERVKMEEIE